MVLHFEEGLAVVEKDGRSGFINKKHQLVAPLQYNFASSFSEGLAIVKLGSSHGFIDTTGKVVIPLEYSLA